MRLLRRLEPLDARQQLGSAVRRQGAPPDDVDRPPNRRVTAASAWVALGGGSARLGGRDQRQRRYALVSLLRVSLG